MEHARMHIRVPETVATEAERVTRFLSRKFAERHRALVAAESDPSIEVPPEVPSMGPPDVVSALLCVPAVQEAMIAALTDIPAFARAWRAARCRESAERLRLQAEQAAAEAEALEG